MIFQVLLESDKVVSMFSNAQISEHPIKQLALSKGHEFVYAMATDQVRNCLTIIYVRLFYLILIKDRLKKHICYLFMVRKLVTVTVCNL